MKHIYIVVLFLSILVFSCDFNKNSHVQDENYERIADRVTAQVARKMKREKGLQCIGVGGGMMSNIQRMSMSFQYSHEVNVSQARELLVYAVTEYLNAINGSKEVRPYLQDYPFKLENIGIMIFIEGPGGDYVPAGMINFMSAVEGVLIYKVSNGGESYSSKKIHEETYEEALKIVNVEAISSEAKAS